MGEFGEGGPSPADMGIDPKEMEIQKPETTGNQKKPESASPLDRIITEEDFTWEKPRSDQSRASVRETYWGLPAEMEALRDAKTKALTDEQTTLVGEYETLIEERLKLLEEWRALDTEIRDKEEELRYSDVYAEDIKADNDIKRRAPGVFRYDVGPPIDPESGKLMSLEAMEDWMRNPNREDLSEKHIQERMESYRKGYPVLQENRAALENFERVRKELKPLLEHRKKLYSEAIRLWHESGKKDAQLFPPETGSRPRA